MIRILCFIAAAIAAPTYARARYIPLSLVDLAGTSDKIAVGVIVKVDEATIDVKIEDLIAGSGRQHETIIVTQFVDWACAWRWEKYAVGQKLLLFLDKDRKQPDYLYDIRGAGDEGESLIVGANVVPRFGVPGRNEKSVQYDQLRAAIVDFRATFRVVRAEQPWRTIDEGRVYLPFDRIDRIASGSEMVVQKAEPPTGNTFKKRFPPGLSPSPSPAPQPTKLVEIPFEAKSSIHAFLAQTVKYEQEQIEKYSEKPSSKPPRRTAISY